MSNTAQMYAYRVREEALSGDQVVWMRITEANATNGQELSNKLPLKLDFAPNAGNSKIK